MLGEKFKNLDSYLTEMSISIKDKLFFLEKIPEEPTLYVDFGCADGTLIENMNKILPNNIYIGYDLSYEMILRAISKFDYDVKNIYFTRLWKNVEKRLEKTKLRKVLILSSVIHEVYSYSLTNNDIDTFWKRVFTSKFDYICIRDMLPDESINKDSSKSDVLKIRSNLNYEVQLEEFERRFGKIDRYKNLVHFLLKYRYKINWDREIKENYLPQQVEQIIERSKLYKYDPIYLERFRIDFLDKCFKDDFNITLDTTTHSKIIFKKY